MKSHVKLNVNLSNETSRYSHLLGPPLYEGTIILLVLAVTILLLLQYGNFQPPATTLIRRTGVLIFAALPALALYTLLRLLFTAAVSSALSLTAIAALALSHHTKLALTGSPLTWSDVVDTSHWHLASRFLSTPQIVVSCAVLVLLTIFAIHSRYRQRAHLSRNWLLRSMPKIVLLITILPLALYPYLPDSPVNLQLHVSNWLFSRLGIYYNAWNQNDNVKNNGVLIHLVQTSRRSIPNSPSPDEAKYQLAALSVESDRVQVPRHIFTILCEACWFDHAHFKDAFRPLQDEGFLEIRAISPAYGGGTANSEFEMLTALPSYGALHGVIFQEYSDVMSPNTQSIISGMRKKGFHTIAIHNFHRNFYNRDVVFKKLGFDRFIALDNMNYSGKDFYPPDNLLFDTALKHLRQNLDRPMFFHLITVHTHGPYPFQHDWGERDYASRLAKTIIDIKRFVSQARKMSPDALFVVYGDHKPSLTKYFYENHMFPTDMFSQTGDRNEDFLFSRTNAPLLGDTPIMVLNSDTQRVLALKKLAQHKPYYCVAASLDELFYGSSNPASIYGQRHVCNAYGPDTDDAGYRKAAKSIPTWLYGLLLFNNADAHIIPH